MVRATTVVITFALLAVVVPAAPMPAAPLPAAAGKSTFYFPTTVGDQWGLRYFDIDSHFDLTHKVTTVEDHGGAKIVSTSLATTIFRQVLLPFPGGGGEPAVDVSECPDLKYRVSADGVAQVGRYELRPEGKWLDTDPAQWLLKLPAIPGRTWTNSSPKEQSEATYVVGKSERVKVPAGDFEAVPVRSKATRDGTAYPSCTRWYAPGLGLIKSVEGDRAQLLMISFTSGKK